jgi:exopolysaccharide biosynthesis WecB/TagA/CpsF family protein
VLFPELVIAGSKPSQFRRLSPDERDAQVAEIASSGAALCFVGLGCPRQEAWVYENRDSVPMPLIAVGAAFDFHAGTLPQAPAQLQRLGFEWAFRLAKEPHRLWRRYLLLNPLYLTYLALQLSHLKRFAASGGSMPPPDLRYG